MPVPELRIDIENVSKIIGSPSVPDYIQRNPELIEPFVRRRWNSRFLENRHEILGYHDILCSWLEPVGNDDISGFDVKIDKIGIKYEKSKYVSNLYSNPLAYLYFTALENLGDAEYQRFVSDAKQAIKKSRPLRDNIFITDPKVILLWRTDGKSKHHHF